MRGMTALAFMTFILVACDGQRGEQHSDAGPLHTPTVSAGLGRVEGLGVFEALMPYLVMEKGFGPASYHVVRTKPLRFPSGRVIAADGIMLLPGAEPFTRTVGAAGAFPIELLVATYHLDSGVHEEIVLAAVRLSESPGHALEWARYGESASSWTGCYAVDSATGGFFDADAYGQFGRYFYRPEADLELAEAFTARGGYALVLEGRDGDGAIFSSGGGDGCYRTYALLSDAGKPVAFVTDFYDSIPPL